MKLSWAEFHVFSRTVFSETARVTWRVHVLLFNLLFIILLKELTKSKFIDF